ncbi:hypothetical protein FE257_009161 [Aspergillus nanangensis]|uniref:Metallo-beta-lactamase domain-containing protein n=1 Tax=Aspergillus nanangensis TaxID=2582783 RepID=A0AAD4CKK8_ASPNN|nr:hypothetical protein FE257_009161 [Aspergillus nanangensis]
MRLPASHLVAPAIPQHKDLCLPSFAFLIEHPTKNRKLLFDLGLRKDFANLPPAVHHFLSAAGWEVTVEKDVSEVLEENNNVTLDEIEAVILSHQHFDHLGNLGQFPKKTKVIVGQRFPETYLPGWPESPKSTLIQSAWEDRIVEEVPFRSSPDSIRIGGFDAVDYFEDGSFYLLDAPGHTVGHIAALARVTSSTCADNDKDTFVLLAGDICHYPGIFRPTEWLPFNAEYPYSPNPQLYPHICPGSVFIDMHPKNSCNDPIYDMPIDCTVDVEAAKDSIRKLCMFDANDDVFVIIAHDATILDEVDFFPRNINSWRVKGFDAKIICIKELKKEANRNLPRIYQEFHDGGAMDLITLRDNEEAFNRYKIRPVSLINVENIDMSTTILNTKAEGDLKMSYNTMHTDHTVTAMKETSPDHWIKEEMAWNDAIDFAPQPSSAMIMRFESINVYAYMQPCMLVEWNGLTKQEKVIFVDIPEQAKKALVESIPSNASRSSCPFLWHTMFAQSLVEVYREAAWCMRHLVRAAEKRISSPTYVPLVDSVVHDMARHTFGLIDTIQVAVHTLQSLIEEQTRFQSRFPDIAGQAPSEYLKNLQKLRFLNKEMYAVEVQARSLSQRIHNLISLAQNEDNQAMKNDNKAMMTIAVLTMVYLPGSFVSGLFGTNFFDFNGGPHESWGMSPSVWIYWAVTVPLTLVTFLLWRFVDLDLLKGLLKFYILNFRRHGK